MTSVGIAPATTSLRREKLVSLVLPPLHPGQQAFVQDPHRIVVAACGTKPIWTGEAVPTPHGWTTIGDLQVGDEVFDEHGQPQRVEYVTPVFFNQPCYRVAMTDGSSVIVDADHYWLVRNYRHGNGRHCEWHEMSTSELIERGLTSQHRGPNGKMYPRYHWQIPASAPWQYAPAHDPLPMDPYVLGAWLGDGTSSGAGFTSVDVEIVDEIRKAGWPIEKSDDRYGWRIDRAVNGKNRFRRILKSLGVLNNKHIPLPYLRASIPERMALLQGLMDTDGYCSRRRERGGTTAEFYSSNRQLSDHAKELAISLGCRVTQKSKCAKIGDREYGECVRLTIKAPFQLFRLARKAERYTPKPVHRAIQSIVPVESVPVKCIRINTPTHLFVVGHDGIVTRQTGKTFGMSIWLILQAWNRYQSLNWWTAPTYRQAKIAYELIGTLLPKERFKPNRTDMAYTLMRADGTPHSRIEFRSADHPETLRGEGVHAAVVDEAGYWQRPSYVSVWTTLTRTRGKLRVISTPKGRNWFYEEWAKGWYPEQRDKFPEYMSYQLPTSANPHVPTESISEAERNLPADVFRQEYLAEFLDESAGVFRNIRNCQTARWLIEPEPKALYVMGIDWAKMADYTVFTIADRQTKEVVHLQRYTGMDWNASIKVAVDTARKWNNAYVIMDATGVGDVPFDSMRAVYPHVEGYTIGNNAAKVALIQKLQFALENQQIQLPAPTAHAHAATLEHELRTYEYEMSSTGKFLFGAPEGYFDDCVISCALANWILQQELLQYRVRSVRGL